eukprot:TRINITY_DN1309_c0_g1_i2.p1 TRINITY_DN1309_c0_g1~~TRINITY_DN1309_c0_g1_i2.p1  ORF type:complete len:474 (-),score=187.90 TRINITY_DN1309_c0_g1_i2:302-1585(-)
MGEHQSGRARDHKKLVCLLQDLPAWGLSCQKVGSKSAPRATLQSTAPSALTGSVHRVEDTRSGLMFKLTSSCFTSRMIFRVLNAGRKMPRRLRILRRKKRSRLEEATKKEMEDKAKKSKVGKAADSKRKRPVATQEESSDSEVEAEPVVKKKGRKKKDDEDDDYKPEADAKSAPVAEEVVKKSPKKTRRSVAAAKAEVKESFKCNQCKSVFLSSNDLQTHMKKTHKSKDEVKTTLDESPDIPKKSDQEVPMSKKPDQAVDVKKSEEKTEVVTRKKSEQVESVVKKSVQVSTVAKKSVEVATTKKSEVQPNAKKSEPIQASKKSDTVAKDDKTEVSEVINLDSPVKEIKTNAAKPTVKEKTAPAPGRSVSIVKIDDDVQEVKSNENSKVKSLWMLKKRRSRPVHRSCMITGLKYSRSSVPRLVEVLTP